MKTKPNQQMFAKNDPQINRYFTEGIVEVLTENGAHYRAHVYDIKSVKDVPTLVVRFRDDWRPIQGFPLSRIRLPPILMREDVIDSKDSEVSGGDRGSGQKLIEGLNVEFLMKSKECEDFGLWLGSIKSIRGDIYIIEYIENQIFGDQIMAVQRSHIVSKEQIRAVNTNPYLRTNPFFKILIEIPNELRVKAFPFVSQSESHKNMKTVLGLKSIRFDVETKALLGIGFDDTADRKVESSTKRHANMLSDIHFRCLTQKLTLMSENENLKEMVKNSSSDKVIKIGNEYELSVRIADEFIGLAIGSKGSNIKAIKTLAGILSVENSEGLFKIRATSSESCLRGRDALYFTESVIEIPKQIISHVIGKKGQYIQEITDKSGVVSITIKGEKYITEEKKDLVPFVLIGRRAAIENAKLLLEFHMNCIKELETESSKAVQSMSELNVKSDEPKPQRIPKIKA